MCHQVLCLVLLLLLLQPLLVFLLLCLGQPFLQQVMILVNLGQQSSILQIASSVVYTPEFLSLMLRLTRQYLLSSFLWL